MVKVLFATLTVLFLVACKPEVTRSKRSSANDNLVVVSTIGMIHDAVKNIAGDGVESVALMGPGIDPHLYRATAGDVNKLEKSDLIIYGGLELEGRMNDIFEKMSRGGRTTFAVGEAIEKSQLLEKAEHPGKPDPHIWFDVVLWKQGIRRIADGLIEAMPDRKSQINESTQKYLDRLNELHLFAKAEIAKIPKDQRVLITAHDAFGYFGRQYGMQVIGIQGTSTATEAEAGKLRELADLIASRRIKAIFVESSVPRATIEALQKAVQARNWNVKIGGQLYSDAMGQEGTPEGTYEGMFRHNVKTIVGALK